MSSLGRALVQADRYPYPERLVHIETYQGWLLTEERPGETGSYLQARRQALRN